MLGTREWYLSQILYRIRSDKNTPRIYKCTITGTVKKQYFQTLRKIKREIYINNYDLFPRPSSVGVYYIYNTYGVNNYIFSLRKDKLIEIA